MSKKSEKEWIFGQESGSGRGTKIILMTRVVKEATDEKMEKLIDEIRFLESIPMQWKKHFPEIVFSKKEKEKVFYEMVHYSLPTIRKLLFSGRFTHKDILKWIDKVLDFSCEMWKFEVMPIPDGYMEYMHFGRVEKRLDELRRKSEVLRRLISEPMLVINGRTYKNIPEMLEILKNPEIENMVLPEYVSRWSHSDMHFSNIMIDLKNDNFILLDPRGYPYCDYYYDYGKLWHSVNGKYEMVAERRFTLQDDYFDLERNNVYFECEKLKKKMPKILYKYSKEPKDIVMMKTEFNEAIHFASLVPFILDFDGNDDRAVVAYYTGVILLNNWYKKYAEEKV